MNIAIISESDRVSDTDVAWIAAAVGAQAEEFCRATGLDIVPVAAYARTAFLDPLTTHVVRIVDDVGEPGALGYHDVDGGSEFALVEAQDVTATGVTVSHEVLELLADGNCDRWAPWRDGKQQAVEVCDRVEEDTYVESVSILGETRGIAVSNYLLPAAFIPGSTGPWDRMGRLTAWDGMTVGGYVLTMDADGNVVPVPFDGRTLPASFSRKLRNARSRTMRRFRNQMRPSILDPEGATP